MIQPTATLIRRNKKVLCWKFRGLWNRILLLLKSVTNRKEGKKSKKASNKGKKGKKQKEDETEVKEEEKDAPEDSGRASPDVEQKEDEENDKQEDEKLALEMSSCEESFSKLQTKMAAFVELVHQKKDQLVEEQLRAYLQAQRAYHSKSLASLEQLASLVREFWFSVFCAVCFCF